MKRIFLFFLVNVLIMITITTVASLLGIEPYLNAYGINYQSLAIWSLLWGMGGAFISLLLSKQIAKWTMGLNIIDPRTSDPTGQYLVQTIHNLARGANLPRMPEVAIYNSPEVNAFATGPSKSNSLVAVSSGLMGSMNRDEIEGVLGHEVAHIANGDMVTMTLVQGVVNAFVIFFAKAVGWAVAQFLSRGEEDEGPSYMMYFAIQMVLQFVFAFLGQFVVAWFSRQREYRADAGGARLAGKGKMVSALSRLQNTTDMVDTRQEGLAAFKISGKPSGLLALLSTHPPLQERIARLNASR